MYPPPCQENLQEDDDEDDEEDLNIADIPYNPFGVIFLRRIQVYDVPRMRAGGPGLSISGFLFFFDKSMEEIKFIYASTGIRPRVPASQRRAITNKVKRTPTYINPAAEPDVPIFNLSEMGHELPPPVVDDGSDVEDELVDGPDHRGINAQISTLWKQFLMDMVIKSPTKQGAKQPYCKLTQEQRLTVGEEPFENLMLSDTWNACQYKLASRDDWKRAFDHLFPPQDYVTSSTVQNYLQCQYYLKWKDLCATVKKETIHAIRAKFRGRLSTFKWIPHACADKLWVTSQHAAFTRLPRGSTGAAPRILVRGAPQWADQ